MASLDKYITSLEEFEGQVLSIVDEIVDFKSSEFVQVVQKRLFNQGRDGDGNLLRGYSGLTIDHKRNSGQPYDKTTLFETGSFYEGMFVNSRKGNVELFSTDSKTDLLINGDAKFEGYGKAILEFTNQEQQKIVDEYIEPEFNKQINSLLPKTIEFSIT